MTRVALITAYNGKGELLFGKRNDNGKYTLPGGHLNEGEDPRAGMVRELHEETGLHPSSLSYLHEDPGPDGDVLYCFSGHVRGEPHGNFDPDQECEHWEFFDITDGIPSKIWNNLHGPAGDANIVRRVFEWEEAEERPEQKLEKTEELGKVVLDPNAGYSFSHQHGRMGLRPTALKTFNVFAHHGGKVVGHAEFKLDPEQPVMTSGDTYVDQKHQRRGVASAMYAHAEKVLGRKAEPSTNQSDEGAALWAGNEKNSQFGKAEDLEKAAPKVWRSDDWGTAAMEIPSARHPDRTQYDANYLSAIKDHYGSVTPVKVPIVGLTFRNDIKNRPRYDLYRKMVRAGDRLPPAVVRRTSSGFEVLDGNHKGQAARDEGAKHLDAVEVPSELSKGQEPLEKMGAAARLFPFNPDKSIEPGAENAIATWQGPDHARPQRENVPYMQGPARARALIKLAAATQTRRGSAGDVQYLLHRGMGRLEHESVLREPGFAQHEKDRSSWTPHHKIAKDFSLDYNPYNRGTASVVSAWIPEGAIHSVPSQLGRLETGGARDYDTNDKIRGANNYADEHEVVVAPHRSELAKPHEVEAALGNATDIDSQINRRHGPTPTTARAQFSAGVHPKMMAKAEDEVERGLDHPDLNERTLTLKLDSVNPRHLQTASLDPHPQVHEAAIAHPRFGSAQVMHLMEATKGTDGAYPLAQQLHVLKQGDRLHSNHISALVRNAGAAPAERERVMDEVVGHPITPDTVLRSLYLDPSTSSAHRQRILQNLNAPADVLEHALHTGLFVPGAEATQLAKLAIQHPHLSSDSRDGLVRMAADRGQPHQREIAMHGLANGHVSEEVREKLFQDAKLKPGPQTGEMLSALLSGPNGGEDRADRVLRDLSPDVWRYILNSKGLTSSHFGQVVAHTHGAKDQQLLSELTAHPMFGPQHAQQLLQKAEILAKSVDPKHFGGIVRSLDPKGKDMVDHVPDLGAHPTAHGDHVEAYKSHVLQSKEKRSPKAVDEAKAINGVTRKKVFLARVSGQKDPVKMMVKPYHERVIKRAQHMQKFPIQGWAEMTHQALYHAAGIGNLHQKVHVAEHDMGPGHEKEPALVVSIHPNARSVWSGGYRRFHGKGESYRKIAIMDFLSNNHDRHGGNLMYDRDTEEPLAIDHGRSFQYIKPRTTKDVDDGDEFMNYHKGTAVNDVEPFLNPDDGQHWHDQQLENLRRYAPTFQWWGGVSDDVKKSFHDRLGQIKDPVARAHVKRNFDERAKWLDERAKFGLENYGTSWYRDSVPMYRPNEMSEDEKEAEAA